MQTKSITAVPGQGWITGGWVLFRRDWQMWLAMTAVYLIIALALQVIPFIGYLVMVLLTPLVIAGAVTVADQGHTRHALVAAAPVERVKGFFAEAAKQLFQGFFHPERTLAVMVVATFTLGAVVFLQIVAQLLKVGGAALPAMLAGGVSASIWLPALISLLVVWALKLIMIAVATLAVLAVVLRNDTPLNAMEQSAKRCLQHALPLAGLSVVFLVPIVVAAYIDTVIAYAIAFVALPLYVTGMYSAAQDLFPRRA